MSNRYVGTKTEIWFKNERDLSGKWYKHIYTVKTNLWSTKGWKVASRRRDKVLCKLYHTYPRCGYSVSFSRSE